MFEKSQTQSVLRIVEVSMPATRESCAYSSKVQQRYRVYPLRLSFVTLGGVGRDDYQLTCGGLREDIRISAKHGLLLHPSAISELDLFILSELQIKSPPKVEEWSTR